MLVACQESMAIGDEVEVDGSSVGELTSVASGSNLTVGLAYIMRKASLASQGKVKGNTVSINSQQNTFPLEGIG